ncbi:hypothetical protein [Cryptosporangium aurantiacum]|uniref:Uncharacterized protein n=1 Tax=Cryptosporangium aurantiacum TaxID=134849 RepID=A0A1M7IRS8_9ACTN|nr:hypothetical protein [Cryptosporangium aurantiacum]SHM43385.1 hypothetical protein SAMN05443668_101573 [Cryptosporangium aurantiacum]
MASIINKLKSFARTPQGQKLMNQAQRELSKPGNQQKLRKLTDRLRGGGSSGGRRPY